MLDLNNRIRVEVIGTKIAIENLYMDFEIELNNEKKPNTANITLWNLSSETMESLKNNGTGVKLYYSEEGRELGLIFEGIKQNKTNMGHISKKPKKSTAKKHRKGYKPKAPHWISLKKDPREFNIESEGGDTSITIELVESLNSYTKSFYSKSFQNSITSDKILKDIASSLNMAIRISPNLKHKNYLMGKSLHQSSQSALTTICDAIGARWHIVDNNTIIVNKIKEPINSKYVYQFDSSDIATPEFEDDNKVKFKTKLLTNLRPDNWVSLATRHITGFFRICNIKMVGSNYSAENETEITVKEG